MTIIVDDPNTTKVVSGYIVRGTKYKLLLVSKGIFNPESVRIHVQYSDLPMFGREESRVQSGIYFCLNRQKDRRDYLWIFNDAEEPLREHIPLLIKEMKALNSLNNTEV